VRYQQVLRDFARRCQSSGDTTGRFLAPRRAATIWLRNTWFNQRFAMDMMVRGARDRTEAIDLPGYATSCRPARGCGDPIGA